jgi:hypothetical protein
MSETGIGRVLVASLHQGIADILPGRLSFYENWLHSKGLRDGTIGLAPLYAVLSFLREEKGEDEDHRSHAGDVYRAITTRAGEYAADWTVDSMGGFERAVLKAAPEWLRGRLVMRVGRRVVRSSYGGSHVRSRLRRRTADIAVRASIFCTVREPISYPLCGFYAAAFTRLLTNFDMRARAEVVTCRAKGEPTCAIRVDLLNRNQTEP